ncbi:MAG: cytochrome c oxidase subunit II [Salibacteraceae bacterium]
MMLTLLILFVGVLGVLAVVQLIRVFELARKIRGHRDDQVTNRENRFQSRMMMVFLFGYFAFFAWCFWVTKDKLLPESASEHGVGLDWLLNFNFLIITIAFVLTHIALFYFAYRYSGHRGHKAVYMSHDNRLELVWTIIPAAFMAVIIIYGLNAWNDITADAPEDAHQIELYSFQFAWRARYPGQDGILGDANYNLVSSTNDMGVMTPKFLDEKIVELEGDIALETAKLKPEGYPEIDPSSTMGKQYTKEINRLERHKKRIQKLQQLEYQDAGDDIMIADTFHIPVNKPVHFVFRSRDVIHSAYMPHFRAQMNTVPGTPTEFHFKPIVTTEEMREKTGDEEFNYYLYCNKICGSSHYNMKMIIIVEDEASYAEWLAEQTTYNGEPAGELATGFHHLKSTPENEEDKQEATEDEVAQMN